MSSPLPSVCIIGAGAAGLPLAHALATRGHRVTLVEGGTTAVPKTLEDTYRVQVVGTPHRGAHLGRFRAWGGSTTRWGGQLWPWERHEFEGRPYLGLDGWPIAYDDVAPYYTEAFSLLGVPVGVLTPDAAIASGVLRPPLDPTEYVLKFSTWLPFRLRNLGRSIGGRLRRNPGVTRHLGTTAVHLQTNSAGAAVSGVELRSADGAMRTERADIFVVAGGAIESARLLLASFQGAARPAMGTHWLGRGFMDHLSVRMARFHPRDRDQFARMFSPIFIRDVQYTPRILLRPATLERERLLGAYGHWEVDPGPESGLFVVRKTLRALQEGRAPRFSFADVRGLAAGARDLAALARGITVDRRRYFPRDAAIHLRVDVEQRPDPESRITLTEERDSNGLPRVSLDWRVSELEQYTVRRTAQLLGEELARAGLGHLDQAVDPFASADGWGALKGDSFHMMGGTRMAASRNDGVVDTNLRVFGLDNLYVAGASTFPTGGMANPTLTLIALSLRLGHHLSRLR